MKTSMCGITLKAICLVNFAGSARPGHIDALGLVPQLVHAFLAGARHRLIGGHDDAGDRRGVMQRLQRHHKLRGRAIGIGDDVAPVGACHVLFQHMSVHFGHDERHILS
jgi:hypothetical protein